MKYKPEGFKVTKTKYTIDEIIDAKDTGEQLTALAVKSDNNLNLYVDLGEGITGVIALDEFEDNEGKATKSVAVITKVGKLVSFKVKDIRAREDGKSHHVILSRKDLQLEYREQFISKLKPGDIVDAKVTHIEDYGLFCDIGAGITALMPIMNISITRVVKPKETLRHLDFIKAVIKSTEDNKITLSHKELLGTWEQEASKFKEGETLIATVKSVKDFGVFVALTPNLFALSKPYSGVEPGDLVAIVIDEFKAEEMKTKVKIVGKADSGAIDESSQYDYRIKEGRIEDWVYSPKGSNKIISTIF